jgi:hypothetical protein
MMKRLFCVNSRDLQAILYDSVSIRTDCDLLDVQQNWIGRARLGIPARRACSWIDSIPPKAGIFSS